MNCEEIIMNKFSIMLSGMLLSMAALQASAQPPAWFMVKHPEVRTMERMQAKEESAARNHALAAKSKSGSKYHASTQKSSNHG